MLAVLAPAFAARLYAASAGQSRLRAASSRQARASVSTLIGNGVAGLSDEQVNNPYGLVFGPDGALYFCDLDNQRIRRLDLTTRRTATIAGNGSKGYAGDGRAATEASLNMPHEIQFDAAGHLYIAERDNHVIRRVEARTGIISTFAGTGTAGFAGDGGLAMHAQLRQPHSIAVDQSRGRLLICDIGNHRIRQVDLRIGRHRHLRRHGGAAADARRLTPQGHAARMGRGPLLSIRAATFIWRCEKAMRWFEWMPRHEPFITSREPGNRDTRAMVDQRARRSWRDQRASPGRPAPCMWPTPRIT